MPAKVNKKEAEYRDRPKGRERCGHCSMFVRPRARTSPAGCSKVAGVVQDYGWCKYWEHEK